MTRDLKPMGKSERYLAAAEAAKALGVSKRTLQFYEEKGLVKPVRTEGGWRAYGAGALARLHQILALKHMGLELSAIARLLEGPMASLDSVLASQEQHLTARQAETHRALDLVRRARSRLSSGEALSVDDLATLTRETTLDRLSEEELTEADDIADVYYRKYLTPGELTSVMCLREQPGLIEGWFEMRSSLRTAMKSGDSTCPAAFDAVRKFRVFLARQSGGDPDLADRLSSLFGELQNNVAWTKTAAAKVARDPDRASPRVRRARRLGAVVRVSRRASAGSPLPAHQQRRRVRRVSPQPRGRRALAQGRVTSFANGVGIIGSPPDPSTMDLRIDNSRDLVKIFGSRPRPKKLYI